MKCGVKSTVAAELVVVLTTNSFYPKVISGIYFRSVTGRYLCGHAQFCWKKCILAQVPHFTPSPILRNVTKLFFSESTQKIIMWLPSIPVESIWGHGEKKSRNTGSKASADFEILSCLLRSPFEWSDTFSEVSAFE